MGFFTRKHRPKIIAEIMNPNGLYAIVICADHRLIASTKGNKKFDRGYKLYLKLATNNTLLHMAAIEAGFPVETMIKLTHGETIPFSRVSGRDSGCMFADLEKIQREIESVWSPRFHHQEMLNAIKNALLIDMKSYVPPQGCKSPRSR